MTLPISLFAPALGGILVVVVCVVLALLRRHARAEVPPGTLVLREPPLTLAMGGVLWLEAAVMATLGHLYPHLLLGTASSALNYGIFVLLSIGLGGWLMLYGRVKRVEANEAGLRLVDPFGQSREVAWEAIDRMDAVVGRRLMLSAGTHRYPVGGNRAEMRAFARLADARLSPTLSREALVRLLPPA